MLGWIIPVAIVGGLLLVGIALYNRLVTLRNRVANSWGQVDVQLRRRYDLVPNLVESVKGYAAHEKELFEEVTRLRVAAQSATGVAEQARAENALTQALGRLFAVAEAYPQLRATENFQQLSTQLAETEDRIAIARQVYNDSVLTYDNARQTVPTNVVAALFGFGEREYFQADDVAREPVQVSF